MAQTHRDDDHLRQQSARLNELVGSIERDRAEAFDELEREAAEMTAAQTNTITAEGEALREWELYGVSVRELPERETDEKLNITRISLGGSSTEGVTYCVFRGSIREAKDILRRALNALRDAP